MSDVCLILEGTYPYVTGGVSSWVHNLIRALPRVRFSLLTILPTRDTYMEYKYEVPENVVSISELYIHETELSDTKTRGRKSQAFEVLEAFYKGMGNNDYSLLPEVYRLVMDPDTRVISPEEIFMHPYTWELVLRWYDSMEMEESFIDFFWTWRYSHLPLFRMCDLKIPKAAVYHSVSTGYGGTAGVLAQIRTGAPYLITEHGIYTNERRIEIEQASWIYERKVDRTVITSDISPFKKMWISLFDELSRLAYHHADEIITLFENNRKMQILGGADPKKTRIIANGINLKNFKNRRQRSGFDQPFRVGFVGRVVPIKDVKTFIRACRIIKDAVPEAIFPVIGPTDEDEEYFEECQALVEMMGLADSLDFMGKRDVRIEYPLTDVIVLTSVSEAQPLVILEANVCGVPSVATDVGACDELLNG
ncbi:MAG: GT4 family glycosyltransferase PelF, partial [Candidatus Lindowbacteria bacterium]|nr:GT4 family glycosyltransferase PelF [Candidatus Lindowbacteria bacterium]